jgi:ribulose 1,5-bisphosphate synthetase/thiazole synthase
VISLLSEKLAMISTVNLCSNSVEVFIVSYGVSYGGGFWGGCGGLGVARGVVIVRRYSVVSRIM